MELPELIDRRGRQEVGGQGRIIDQPSVGRKAASETASIAASHRSSTRWLDQGGAVEHRRFDSGGDGELEVVTGKRGQSVLSLITSPCSVNLTPPSRLPSAEP